MRPWSVNYWAIWRCAGWTSACRVCTCRAAARRHAGEAALIQRCQVHKRRNVIAHLPEEHKSAIRKNLQNAYTMTEYADAKRAVDSRYRERMELNPSAARSLKVQEKKDGRCIIR